MRCFLAVDIPKNITEKIIEIQKGLEGFDTKLVEKNNFHFTLKFLGELGQAEIEEVVKRVSEIEMNPFTVKLKKIGFFPSSSFIRVVWIGAESEEFLELHNKINDKLKAMFPREKAAPHLTLARIKTQNYNAELRGFAAEYSDMEAGEFAVDSIKLKKSTLARSDPVYEDLMTFKLRKG